MELDVGVTLRKALLGFQKCNANYIAMVDDDNI
jgi:hypothetical protein